ERWRAPAARATARRRRARASGGSPEPTGWGWGPAQIGECSRERWRAPAARATARRRRARASGGSPEPTGWGWGPAQVGECSRERWRGSGAGPGGSPQATEPGAGAEPRSDHDQGRFLPHAASQRRVVDLSDREINTRILESCRSGDRDAFRALYDAYKD